MPSQFPLQIKVQAVALSFSGLIRFSIGKARHFSHVFITILEILTALNGGRGEL